MQKPMSTPPQKPILQPPLTPAVAEIETQRVGALLEINRLLIQEIIQLQAAGRTGPPSKAGPDQQGQSSAVLENASTEAGTDGSSAGGDKKQVPSREYMEYDHQIP